MYEGMKGIKDKLINEWKEGWLNEWKELWILEWLNERKEG